MTARPSTTLKALFESGKIPTYEDFVDLIDSRLSALLDNFPDPLPAVSGKNLLDIGEALPDPLPARSGENLTGIKPAEFNTVGGMPVPTYATNKSIVLVGNWTSEFPTGRRLVLTIAGSAFYTESTGASFDSGTGVTTVNLLDAMPGSGITACAVSIIHPTANGGAVSLSTLGMTEYMKTVSDDPDAPTARQTLGLDTLVQRAVAEYATNNWIERTSPKAQNGFGVTFDSTSILFVLVGAADGTDALILTSTDGASWTERSNPKAVTLRAVVHAAGLYVAVGDNDGSDAYIVTSTDGITWTERSNPKNISLFAITHGNGLFVAVGSADGADAYIVTSPDGITWTERANSQNRSLFGVIFANSQFVAVGQNDGTDAYMLTSPDGITWTERSNPKNFTLNCVTFGNGLFVAAGAALEGTDAYLVTSPDGITWTERANPSNLAINAIAYANNVFLAVGVIEAGKYSYMILSHDGITWARRVHMKTNTLNAVTLGQFWFVVTGNGDSDTYIITSLRF